MGGMRQKAAVRATFAVQPQPARKMEPDPEHNRQASDLIFQGHPLADQLLARADQRANGVRGKPPATQ
jgi:hypothetical protein